MAALWSNPVRVEYGWGRLSEIAGLVEGRAAILITTRGMVERGTVARVEAALAAQLIAVWAEVESNPTIAACERAAASLPAVNDAVVIGLGGGSALDTAKAVALSHAPEIAPGFLSDLLRSDASLPGDFGPPPMILIPTTSGTGSEVTRWGTVWDERDGAKYSVSHPRLYPEIALVDPELTMSVPQDTTVFTALDALSHSLESIWNQNANQTSDGYALQAIRLIHAALPKVLDDPRSRAIREDLSLASLRAGLAFSNTATAIAHSISYPLTSSFGVPHGLACSLTLAEVLRVNATADPARCNLILEALDAADLERAVEAIYRLFAKVRLGDRLKQFIPTEESLSQVKGTFIAPGRAANNLVPIDQETASRILRDAYHNLTN